MRETLSLLPLDTYLSVDKQMDSFKRSLNIKQYIKKSVSKFLPFVIQVGKFLVQGATTELDKEQVHVFGHGTVVVLKSSERISQCNIGMYFGNYVFSYNLRNFCTVSHLHRKTKLL